MTNEEARKRLLKEIQWLDQRAELWLANLRTVRVGQVTAVVNGMASPHYAHLAYLEKRRLLAIEKLQRLNESKATP